MTNDQLNIAELQKLALRIPAQEWTWGWNGDVCAVWGNAIILGGTGGSQKADRQAKEDKASFIAAANPQAILSLIERIKELERSLAEYVTKRDVAVSSLEIVKEQRTAAQKALAEQCKETRRWKQMAEFQYAMRVYPNELELGQGALDAYMRGWSYDAALASSQGEQK